MLSPASTERVTLSKNSRRLVRQDLPLLKPCCESFIKWSFIIWPTSPQSPRTELSEMRRSTAYCWTLQAWLPRYSTSPVGGQWHVLLNSFLYQLFQSPRVKSAAHCDLWRLRADAINNSSSAQQLLFRDVYGILYYLLADFSGILTQLPEVPVTAGCHTTTIKADFCRRLWHKNIVSTKRNNF